MAPNQFHQLAPFPPYRHTATINEERALLIQPVPKCKKTLFSGTFLKIVKVMVLNAKTLMMIQLFLGAADNMQTQMLFQLQLSGTGRPKENL